MSEPAKMPSPEKVARDLQELRATTRRLGGMYKALYVAAKNGSSSGGSLGQIGSGTGRSDPTAGAALSPSEAELRRGVKYCALKIQNAVSDLAAAEKRYEGLLERPPSFEEKPRAKWRVHTWVTLTCGCAHDDAGWWTVRRACSVHIDMIPLVDRAPFLQLDEHAEFGAFQPDSSKFPLTQQQ